MNAASLFLFALVTLLLLWDILTLRKAGRRILILEALAFTSASVLIVRQDLANWMAHKVGLWRGADFVIYPVMVWLFREALLSRHARWVEGQRIDRFVRASAIRDARVFPARNDPF
jgi:small membrane protein